MILWGGNILLEQSTATPLTLVKHAARVDILRIFIFGFKCNHQMLIETAISNSDKNQLLGVWSGLATYLSPKCQFQPSLPDQS